MSQQDITIVRRFPVINGFVIIPDYGPNKIPLADALALPGVRLNSLIGNVEIFLETLPGVVGCCGNVPADGISEIVKEEVPGYPPNPYEEPCVCPYGDEYLSTYLSATFFDYQGQTPYIPPEQCGCQNSFATSQFRLSPDTGINCRWFGTAQNGDFTVVIEYDSVLCKWLLSLYCDTGSGTLLIWQGIRDTRDGVYVAYTANQYWCAGIQTVYVTTTA